MWYPMVADAKFAWLLLTDDGRFITVFDSYDAAKAARTPNTYIRYVTVSSYSPQKVYTCSLNYLDSDVLITDVKSEYALVHSYRFDYDLLSGVLPAKLTKSDLATIQCRVSAISSVEVMSKCHTFMKLIKDSFLTRGISLFVNAANVEINYQKGFANK